MARCGCAGSSDNGGITKTVVATNGGTTVIASGTSVVLLTPAGTIAGYTLTLPDTTRVFDDEILVLTTQTITTLTVNTGGTTTTAGIPTTLAANAYFRVRLFGTVWSRVG